MEPITRAEQIMSGESLEPITREEMFFAKAAGMNVETPAPITRREMFLSKISGGGGGTIEPLSVTANGTYNPPEGVDGYSPVTVSVESSGGDEWEEQFIASIERLSTKVTKIPDGVTWIGNYAFYGNGSLALTSLPAAVSAIGPYAFRNCSGLNEITFMGKPSVGVDGTAFMNCNNLLTINVPWADGEVANAPWGATKATINYNYTGG